MWKVGIPLNSIFKGQSVTDYWATTENGLGSIIWECFGHWKKWGIHWFMDCRLYATFSSQIFFFPFSAEHCKLICTEKEFDVMDYHKKRYRREWNILKKLNPLYSFFLPLQDHIISCFMVNVWSEFSKRNIQ